MISVSAGYGTDGSRTPTTTAVRGPRRMVLPITLADTDRARTLLVAHPQLSARDALHAAVMMNNELSKIATFDAGFDAVPRIARYIMAL